MKKDIHIKFVDFWNGFNESDNFIVTILSKKYNVCFSDKPTYIFFSAFGFKHIDYDCVKIFFTGENNTPNFDLADYGIGFNHLSLQDRYIRIPLYVIYEDFQVLKNKKILDRDALLNRKFCSFVYSNNKYADNSRTEFYRILSKYKKVDSGGGLLNNVGGRVDDKMEFIKDYKFNIAFENSSFDGYTTEKIMQPMCVNSLPIYWGNPSVGKDFNAKSFVNAADFNTLKELAEYIIYLDKNDDAYMEKLGEPWLNDNENMLNWEKELLDFLSHIIEQNVEKAKRIPQFGYTKVSLDEYRRFYSHSEALKGKSFLSRFWKSMKLHLK